MNEAQIIARYTLAELLTLLPAEVIYEKKKCFLMDEVFELAIRKGAVFNTWTIEYYNERSVKYLVQEQHKDLAVAIARVLEYFIQEKYITIVP